MSFNSENARLRAKQAEDDAEVSAELARAREVIGLRRLRDDLARAGQDAVREWAMNARGQIGAFHNVDMGPHDFAALASSEAAADHAIYRARVRIEASDGRGTVAMVRHVLVKRDEAPPEGGERVGSVKFLADQARVAAVRRVRGWLEAERDRIAAEQARTNRRDVTR